MLDRRELVARTHDEQVLRLLTLAARRVWRAYLAWGPVDDGRPEGDKFTEALEELERLTPRRLRRRVRD